MKKTVDIKKEKQPFIVESTVEHKKEKNNDQNVNTHKKIVVACTRFVLIKIIEKNSMENIIGEMYIMKYILYHSD